jgi:hypothetical protein
MSDQKVIIVDSIMGSGKTTWLFDHINGHRGQQPCPLGQGLRGKGFTINNPQG